jgi:hypothetical protein
MGEKADNVKDIHEVGKFFCPGNGGKTITINPGGLAGTLHALLSDDDDLVPGEAPDTAKGHPCLILETTNFDVCMRSVFLR